MEVSTLEMLGAAVGGAVSLFLVWRDSVGKLSALEALMSHKLDSKEFEEYKRTQLEKCGMIHLHTKETIDSISESLTNIQDGLNFLRRDHANDTRELVKILTENLVHMRNKPINGGE